MTDTEKNLVRRLRRALLINGELLVTNRGRNHVGDTYGEYFIVDLATRGMLHRDVDLEDLDKRIAAERKAAQW